MANGDTITLDKSTLKPLAQPVTLDKSTLKPQPMERAMQQTMGGPPMFVDVPKGEGTAFEQAGKEGYQTGATAGAEGVGAAAALAIPGVAISEAIASRSIAPLMPIIASYLGSKFGYHAGKDIGGLFGQEEIGGKVGAVAGGVVGGVTGKVPTMGIRSLLLNLLKGGEEGEGVAAAEVGAAKASGKIIAPDSPPPPINRTLVSYARPTLVQMARGGDLDALRELMRNPGGINVQEAVPNAKYLLEGGAPTNIYGGPK